MSNPFLKFRALNELPAFSTLTAEHAAAAVQSVLTEARARVAELLGGGAPPSWSSLIEPLEQVDQRIAQVWGPISHLFGVSATPEWRKAYNDCLPLITDYGLEMAQSEPLYRAYRAIAERADFAALDPVQQKVINDALRDFKLAGIGLPEAQKTRYRELSMRLSEVQTRFEENLMDAIQAWSKPVAEASALAGLSETALRMAAAKAQAKGLEGYLLTLDYPSFNAVISHAHDRALREELYIAHTTRASDQGPQAGQFDNTPHIEEILALRAEQAQLLGFANYAELSLATKMAESPAEVERFLLDLAVRARPRAQAELAALQAFADSRGGPAPLQSWDLAYYTEMMKDEQLGLADEALRPYFPLPRVLDGLFTLLQRLYALQVTAVDDVDCWHPDVRVFALIGPDGQRNGLFYLDPYAREHKRSGAWMDECQIRHRRADGLQIPVAYLVCNFRPAEPGMPALLTHDDVLTLFHEFGHGLHLLLTQVDEVALAGIRGVEWDAVELPSQFMENWCYDRDSLRMFARHWQTGEPLPDALLDKLQRSRVFQAGLSTVRQIEFALFDLRLHRDYDPARGARLLPTLQAVRDEVAVLQPPAINRMPWSFGHIFSGGYAAGYYSYKWAEVLSADVFAAFEEQPGRLAETGARFRDCVLARGGSQPASELFAAFRGRAPSIEPLLRHNGLTDEAA